MPYILTGNDLKINNDMFVGKEFDYDYPGRLDLRPTSELHNSIVSKLLRYALESSRIASERHSSWNKMDDKLRAYIALDKDERKVRAEDWRKPVSIVFPYSYAILETLISYLVASSIQDPIFRYEGQSPEDVAGGLLLEKVIGLHCIRNKVALNLHTFFRDACAYGIGVVSPQWTVQMGKRRGVERVMFEGNSLVNVDPYCYLPDPSVAIHDVQAGEFSGWLDRTNIMDLLSQEPDDEDMFNVKYVQTMTNKSTTILGLNKHNRTRQSGVNASDRMDRMIADPVDQLHMYIKLIPKQWKLGTSERPEKWLFTLAADSVIIRAKPINLDHNLFPIAVAAPDFDGYSPVAYSRLEVLSGMQTTIDWLFNSHIANVRKAINDVLIVDPYLINVADLKNPGAGGLVRLRRPAWGKGVKDAVMQLNVVDITRQNIADVAAIIQYMQTIGGTDNPFMGSLRRGGPERLTTQEFQGTAQGAVNRLERVAKVVGMQALQDIAYMFAYHTQQLMEQDTWVRTVGEWPETIRRTFEVQEDRVLVTPNALDIDYDVIPRDGSVPGGNFSDAWVQIFQTIGSNELLSSRIDVFRVFKYIALMLGAKNVDDFELRPQVPPAIQLQTMPDEQIADQAQRGNIIPIGAAL